MRVEAFQGEWVVAVSADILHTVTRGGSVFGWGVEEGLGLPDTDMTISEGGVNDVFSLVRYPELRCGCAHIS
jgi:hypothetical protein